MIERVLWDSVPAYLRRLDGVLKETVGKTLPIQAAPVVFASWMGGDRCAKTPSFSYLVLVVPLFVVFVVDEFFVLVVVLLWLS